MSANDAKIVHLYNLAHYRCLNPVSSSHAVASARIVATADVNTPRPKAHCDSCGVYQIPGITSSTRIKYSKVKFAGGKRARVLTTKCLVCHNVERDTGLLNVSRAQTPQNASTGDGSKKRKKKKKNTLSALLEKKQQESKPLGLFDFM